MIKSGTEKNSLKIAFLGRIFLGHQGSRCQDIPDPGCGKSRTKTLCARLLFLLFEGMAGMSRDLGRDVPGFGSSRGELGNFTQETLG